MAWVGAAPAELSEKAKPGLRPRGSDVQGLRRGEAKAGFANVKGFQGPFMRLLMGKNQQNQNLPHVWAGSQQVRLPLVPGLT